MKPSHGWPYFLVSSWWWQPTTKSWDDVVYKLYWYTNRSFMINITSISWHWPVSEARHTLTYHKVSEARHTLMYHKWISDIEPVSWFSWIFNSTSVWASSTLANYTLGGNDWKPLSCLFRGFNSFSSWLTFSITLTSSECSIVESFPPSLLSNFSMSLWYWILFFMGEYSSECPGRGGVA